MISPRGEDPVETKLSEAKRKLLEQRLKGRIKSTRKERDPDALQPKPAEAPLLASVGQERIWLLHQMDPSSANGNISNSFYIEGAKIDLERLEASVNAVLDRHHVLHCNYRLVEGQLHLVPRQQERLAIRHVDAAPGQSLEDCLAEFAREPFDLEKDLMLRVCHAGDPAGRSLLMLVTHDILFDKWSLGLFWKEVSAFYNSRSGQGVVDLPELPVQYSDFAHWQRNWLDSGKVTEQEIVWKRLLSNPPPPLPLSTDRPYPETITQAGRLGHGTLSPETTARLRQLAASEDCSMFTVLLYGFNLLLNAWSCSEDILVSAPVANRRHRESTSLIGFFLNTLCFRADLSGNPTLLEGLRRIRSMAREAMENQDIPLDRIVDAIKPPRVEGRHPLVQTMFVYQREDEAAPTLSIDGATTEYTYIETRCSKFDLTLFMAEEGSGMHSILEYRTDLFDPATIQRMLGHLEVILDQLVSDPGKRLADLDLCGEAERKLLLQGWQGEAKSFDKEPLLPESVAAQAHDRPGKTAVLDGDKELTYGELLERAGRLAAMLAASGLEPGQKVGLFLPRSARAIASLLGILRAGGTYVPIDPDYPEDRVSYIIGDSGIRLMVTSSDFAAKLPKCPGLEVITDLDPAPSPTRLPELDPSSPAYVIYTSGSTGRPKGVVVSHDNLRHSTHARLDYYEDAPERFLLIPSLAFDSSIAGIFWTLATGGTLVIPDAGQLRDPEAMGKLIETARVNMLLCVPTLYRELLSWDSNRLALLTSVIVAGENCPPGLVQQHFAKLPACRLFNEYGPTEATVWATVHECTASDADAASVPIGLPIANASAHVLDRMGRILPPGIAGELHLGGKGLAIGYHQQESLSREKFVSKMKLGRLYRTGDLVKRRVDGKLNFLGRTDDQVKIRGYRIELGEIERALESFPDIAEAAVVTTGTSPDAGHDRMVAFVRMVGEAAGGNTRDWRDRLGEKLPAYMVPSEIRTVTNIPRTPNGKADRKQLSRQAASPSAAIDRIAGKQGSATETGPALLAIWRELLGRPDLGMDDNFFENGGDSILAIQVISRAQKAGIEISVTQLFSPPTVAGLCSIPVEPPVQPSAPGAAETDPAGALPLTPVQSWLIAQESRLDLNQWNLSYLLELSEAVEAQLVERCLAELVNHHHALRMALIKGPAGWSQRIPPVGGNPPVLHRWDLSEYGQKERESILAERASELQASMRLDEGCLLRAAWISNGPDQPPQLLLIVHHMAVDGVSWNIFLNDLHSLMEQGLRMKPLALTGSTVPFRQWAQALVQYSESPELDQERQFWEDYLPDAFPALPSDHKDSGPNNEASAESRILEWDQSETVQLLEALSAAPYSFREVLLAATAKALSQWLGTESCLMEMEGHGREECIGKMDTSSTVGWFTSIFPLELRLPAGPPDWIVRSVATQLSGIPNKGIGHGILKHLSRNPGSLRGKPEPEVTFNHMGRLDSTAGLEHFSIVRRFIGEDRNPLSLRTSVFEINSWLEGGRLRLDWSFSRNLHRQETVERLLDRVKAFVDSIARKDTSSISISGEPSPGTVEEVFPLTAGQSSILAHHLQRQASDTGLLQVRMLLPEDLDTEIFSEVWNHLVEAFPALRSSARWENLEHPVQVVHRKAEATINLHDLSDLDPESFNERFDTFLDEDRKRGLDLRQVSPMRLTLFRQPDNEYRFVWTCHHIFTDGWSCFQVLQQMAELYGRLRQGKRLEMSPRPDFGNYREWLSSRPVGPARTFWKRQLAGFEQSSLLTGPAVSAAGLPDIRWSEYHPESLQQEALKSLAGKYGVTSHALLLGTWGLILSELLKSRKLALGCTFSGRTAPVEGIGEMVGMLANTIPVCLQLETGETPGQWFRKIFRQQQAIQQFEYCSQMEIQGWAQIAPDRPLFDTLFIYANQPWQADDPEKAEGLAIREFRGGATSAFPLTVSINPGRRTAIAVGVDTNRLDPSIADHIQSRFREILEAFGKVSEESIQDILKPVPDFRRTARNASGTKPGLSADRTPPRNSLDAKLQAIWKDVFKNDDIGIDANFFDLGGNSLLGFLLVSRVKDALKQPVSIDILFKAPTIRLMADNLKDWGNVKPDEDSLLVPIRTKGDKPPLVLVHPLDGEVYPYRILARYLDPEQPIYGIRSPEVPLNDLEAMADAYNRELLEHFPEGSFILGGYCFGGAVAFCMARKLRAMGRRPERLVIIDLMFPKLVRYRPRYLFRILREESPRQLATRIVNKVKKRGGRLLRGFRNRDAGFKEQLEDYFELPPVVEAVRKKIETHFFALSGFSPSPYEGPVSLILSDSPYSRRDPYIGWDRLVKEDLTSKILEVSHWEMMKEPDIEKVAAALEGVCPKPSTGAPR